MRGWCGRGVLLALVALAVPLSDTVAQQQEEEPPPEHKLRISGYPYVFSTPEAGVALGVGGIVTFYTSNTDIILRPSKVTLGGWYSLNNQYKITLNPQVYLDRNRWQLSMPLDYGRFTERFWGIGNQTEAFAEDTTTGAPNEKYRMSSSNLKLEVQGPPLTKIAGRLLTRVGMSLEGNNTQILDTLSNPLIDSTLVGYAGGQTLGLGLIWVFDSRNQTFFPSAGMFLTIKAVGYPRILFADYGYARLEADVRTYIGRSPDEVLALQAYGSFEFGNPPFYALSALGGASRMRGYYQGRYRDRHYFTAQAEYRRMVWWRLGFAAFVGTGEVFGSEGSDLRFKNLVWSFGGGLRFAFNQAERVNLRVDLGIGKHTTGLYFQLEEAF